MFQDGKIPSIMANGGCTQISPHLCESAASTLDDHNFLVRTSIRAFLNSTESSLSIKSNNVKCSAKLWAEHWARSRPEEWSVLVFGTSIFETCLYLKCLGLCIA